MTENRSYNYIQGQGQGYLGHMIPRWTSHVIVDMGLLKGGKITSIIAFGCVLSAL